MLDDLRYRLTALFRRRALERDLDEELEFHIEEHAALDERAGVPRQEALRRARLAFGGVDRAKEESRDGRGVRVLEIAWRDLRYAMRTLARSPIFTLVAIVSLTLGIGANTAMFQLLNALVLRPLPVAQPHELVEVNLPERDLVVSGGNFPRWPALSYPLWEQLRERQEAFSAMFAWADEGFNLAPAGEVRRVQGVWVSGNYFPVLGLTPALGRLFTAADDRPGCGLPGAVVSYDFWQRELGGDPRAVGRTLTVDGVPVDVIGVAPAGFLGLQVGQRFDVALPICSLPAMRPGSTMLTGSTQWWITAMGRLKPGWTIERAEAYLRTLAPGIFAASLPPDYPAASAKAHLASTLTATPAGAGRSDLRGAYSTPLRLLLAMTGFVLLIACANLTNLMLARGAVRRRELSLRLALGASRGRLISQLLCESVIIAGASALAGAFIAQVLSRILVRLLGSSRDPIVLTLTPDWRVVVFMAATALITCLLLGVTPALRVSRGSPGDALKGGARSVTGDHESLLLRRALVVAQVAVSLVLVVGALLFARSFRNLLAEPLGFEPEGVLIVQTTLPPPSPTPEAAAALDRELIASLRAVPGVDAVGESMIFPLSGNNSTSNVWLDGASRDEGRQASFNRVSRGYFDALGMRLLAGRDIADTDTPGSPYVAVVNETFARTFAPGGSPIGRRFWVAASSSTSPERAYEIVGLVADAKYQRLREQPKPVAFISLAQRGGPGIGGTFMVRSAATVQTFTPALRGALARVHPDLRFVVRTFDDQVRDATLRDRAMAMLSSLFGLLAALLAAVGLHGVVSYAVERRRREIGIRLALGASRGAIVGSVLRESGFLIGTGLVLGIVLSLALTGAARSLLFGLEPRDAGTIAIAVAALTLVALMASVLPAQRAALLDPMSTLKDD
jgi:putative ABC transport system permease protein